MLEVSKADYDSCSTGSPVATHNSGNDITALSSPVTRYFICGFTGHCSGGMKLQVDIVPGAGSLAPAGAPAANAPVSPPTPASFATKTTATGLALAGVVLLTAGLMA